MAVKKIDNIDELKSVYYIYGDEELLVEQALTRLKSLFSAEADADFNMELINAAEAGAEHVVDSAETIPLMASRRLVIARDVDKLPRKEQEVVARYLERPNPATTLVLVAAAPGAQQPQAAAIKKIESSMLFKKAGLAGGEALKFSMAGRGRQKKVADWIFDEFARRGKRIEPAARDALIEKVGVELRHLRDAIERISLYAADSDVITVEVVLAVVVPAAEHGIFELVDSVAERRRDVSLYALNRLLMQGESPQRIFSLLLRQCRLIARCKSMGHDRPYGEIASELGVPPFVVGKCMKQASRFSSDRLRDAFSLFKTAQLEMHSNRYLSDKEYQASILELLIVKVIG